MRYRPFGTLPGSKWAFWNARRRWEGARATRKSRKSGNAIHNLWRRCFICERVCEPTHAPTKRGWKIRRRRHLKNRKHPCRGEIYIYIYLQNAAEHQIHTCLWPFCACSSAKHARHKGHEKIISSESAWDTFRRFWFFMLPRHATHKSKPQFSPQDFSFV